MVNCHSTGRECDMYYGPANYPDYCMIEYFASETEEKCLKKVPLFGDRNKKSTFCKLITSDTRSGRNPVLISEKYVLGDDGTLKVISFTDDECKQGSVQDGDNLAYSDPTSEIRCKEKDGVWYYLDDSHAGLPAPTECPACDSLYVFSQDVHSYTLPDDSIKPCECVYYCGAETSSVAASGKECTCKEHICDLDKHVLKGSIEDGKETIKKDTKYTISNKVTATAAECRTEAKPKLECVLSCGAQGHANAGDSECTCISIKCELLMHVKRQDETDESIKKYTMSGKVSGTSSECNTAITPTYECVKDYLDCGDEGTSNGVNCICTVYDCDKGESVDGKKEGVTEYTKSGKKSGTKLDCNPEKLSGGCQKIKGGRCHPNDSIVNVKHSCNHGICVSPYRMDALRIGDIVEGNHGIYEPIIAFSHRNYKQTNDYWQFVAGNHTLEISSGHYLYANGKIILPKDVRVGDSFSTNELVSHIKKIHKTGLIHPHTWSSTLVVNGIKTSVNTVLYEAPLVQYEYLQNYVTTPIAFSLYKSGIPVDITPESRLWAVEDFIMMTKDLQDYLRRVLPEVTHPIAALPFIGCAFVYAFPEIFVMILVMIFYSKKNQKVSYT